MYFLPILTALQCIILRPSINMSLWLVNWTSLYPVPYRYLALYLSPHLTKPFPRALSLCSPCTVLYLPCTQYFSFGLYVSLWPGHLDILYPSTSSICWSILCIVCAVCVCIMESIVNLSSSLYLVLSVSGSVTLPLHA